MQVSVGTRITCGSMWAPPFMRCMGGECRSTKEACSQPKPSYIMQAARLQLEAEEKAHRDREAAEWRARQERKAAEDALIQVRPCRCCACRSQLCCGMSGVLHGCPAGALLHAAADGVALKAAAFGQLMSKGIPLCVA